MRALRRENRNSLVSRLLLKKESWSAGSRVIKKMTTKWH
jgi:hypothetical protein